MYRVTPSIRFDLNCLLTSASATIVMSVGSQETFVPIFFPLQVFLVLTARWSLCSDMFGLDGWFRSLFMLSKHLSPWIITANQAFSQPLLKRHNSAIMVYLWGWGSWRKTCTVGTVWQPDTTGSNHQDRDSDTSHSAAPHFSFFVSECFVASSRNIHQGLSSTLY